MIIHLALSGIFLKDTDLFPRNITRLLNSDIEPVYNLVKQLAILFPVYFNDIGAEGRLRDISTQIDEISGRKDILIHFLRKQSHVESSNRIIDLMEAILHFWETKDKTTLRPFVPPTIYDQIESDGPFVDGVHGIMTFLKEQGILIPKGFLSFQEERLPTLNIDSGGFRITDNDLNRVSLAISLYKIFVLFLQ